MEKYEKLKARLSEDKYYYTLYDSKSVDAFDLQPNNTYHFNIKVNINQLFKINFNILEPDYNDTHLPLNNITFYEDKTEFSSRPYTKKSFSIAKLSHM